MERTGPIALEVVARKDCTAKGLGMPEGLHSRLKHNCETWLILWLEEDSCLPNGRTRMDG